ncbi:branched-chain amino acid ABC transporter substrate-binding protein [Massilia terrae]|uniref:Branched-chain amino acid ABC transporter substrate-binding protein n=2 Tax=Massilia terrae TaxID=1811224 RepID=A0ABT2CTK7_9BURK|nr:branched-chain amino acid ABC transporter substrate-binding protein [Massilia terrae]MCS0657307.1 branched-chain amino acid ABC transporter substrate-binding protein [Massilia terrae]
MAADQLTVKIGHVAAVSGPLSYFGKDNENGARMAIDELNSRNITIGGKKAKFVLLAEDDAGEPRLATVVAQKLVDAKVNAVIGHETSGTSIPASKIYHDAGIPEISAATTSPKYTEQGFNTTFRVVVNDKQLGRTLGRYAVKDMKAKRVALIDDRTAYGQGIAAEFVKGLQEAGGAIVTKEYTDDKKTEFGAILTKVRASNPDLIFFGGMSAVAGPMLHQMKALGMGKLRFIGGDGICSDEIATLSQGAMSDGQVVCAEAGGIEDSAKAGLEKFNANYKKRFGIDVQIYAPYVYDSIMTIVEAMVKAGSAEPAKYLPVLAQIRHSGLTGLIAFDQRGDIRDGTLTLYTFKNGHRTRIAVTK